MRIKPSRRTRSRLTIDTLKRLLDETGALLFRSHGGAACHRQKRCFVIDEESLFYPFDATACKRRSAVPEKDVSYRLSKGKTATLKASASWRGLIVDDEDTDPEKGAEAVSVFFPGAIRIRCLQCPTEGYREHIVRRFYPDQRRGRCRWIADEEHGAAASDPGPDSSPSWFIWTATCTG